MNIFHAIFLGVIQGLTEFLPISSSGHLVFFQSLFGMKEPQLFFDVMLHFGTLLAVMVYFRRDISGIIRGIGSMLTGKGKNEEGIKFFFWILVASIPTGLMGILFKDWFESLFSKPKIVGGMLLITGSILYLTRWAKREDKYLEKMNWVDALLIGVAQGIAIIPGISRSGATISMGLFCGLNRELAGTFSFLLSIPAILGATILEMRKIQSVSEILPALLGMGVAFGVGSLSLTFLIKIIKAGKLSNFSYYCWAMGLLMLFLVK
ncbi:MAG: undecaprenyl-diphosphate phosphatase [Deltaproteobacteria bacterium]|nr:undecaprenyl-diphosphate phosphatase [Deltaproteobacteria bacterium]